MKNDSRDASHEHLPHSRQLSEELPQQHGLGDDLKTNAPLILLLVALVLINA